MVVFPPDGRYPRKPAGRLAWRPKLHINSKAGGIAAASAVWLHKFPKKSIYGKLATRSPRIRPI
jgi:hypothetical protein